MHRALRSRGRNPTISLDLVSEVIPVPVNHLPMREPCGRIPRTYRMQVENRYTSPGLCQLLALSGTFLDASGQVARGTRGTGQLMMSAFDQYPVHSIHIVIRQ